MPTAEEIYNQLKGAVQPGAQAFLQSFCQQYAQAQANGQALPALPSTQTPPGGMNGCQTPAMGGARNPNFPSLSFANCPATCDPCAFPAIDMDLFLHSWPEIEAQMWDSFTQIDLLTVGALPVPAGGTIVLEQQARRTLTWIPDCVEISTTWSGGPSQPGLVTYQWGSGVRGSPGLGIQFGDVTKGQQYEPNPAQTTQVQFPTYKGCNNMVIGTLSTLRLAVSLASTATSVLESVSVTCYHRKRKTAHCAANGACSCNK